MTAIINTFEMFCGPEKGLHGNKRESFSSDLLVVAFSTHFVPVNVELFHEAVLHIVQAVSATVGILPQNVPDTLQGNQTQTVVVAKGMAAFLHGPVVSRLRVLDAVVEEHQLLTCPLELAVHLAHLKYHFIYWCHSDERYVFEFSMYFSLETNWFMSPTSLQRDYIGMHVAQTSGLHDTTAQSHSGHSRLSSV